MTWKDNLKLWFECMYDLWYIWVIVLLHPVFLVWLVFFTEKN